MDSAFRRTQSLRYPKSSASGLGSPSNFGGSRKVRDRSLRSKSSRSRGDGGGLSRLTATQRQALLTSWRLLRPQAGSVMRKILDDLSAHSSKVKDIFYRAALVDCFVSKEPKRSTTTLEDHVKLMVQFFDDLLATIDDEAAASTMIKHVGQQHAILSQTCGFTADIWEKLGEIAMEKICAVEVISKSREAGRGWRAVIAFVTDELRCGYDGEAKAFNRRNSADLTITPDAGEDLTRQLHEMRLEYTDTVPMG